MKFARKNIFLPYRICVLTFFYSASLSAQQADSLLVMHTLKKLSLEELMNVEVTSVSKRPEKLQEAASAIQVITCNDIHLAGVKTLPEALRLAANLMVAQVNASDWAISARGFNNTFSNKLLVLIDGRVIYTPLHAGVFWDVQNLLLEDVDRIEVISGPGGTLWGANAVNGVINIITKNAADTKGVYAELAKGTSLPVLGSIRYGAAINKNIAYRVYGTGFKMGNSYYLDSSKSKDEWHMLDGGFRVDWDAGHGNKMYVLGSVYGGKPNPDATDTPHIARGDNLLVRWNGTAPDNSGWQLQVYYDHTWRDFGNNLTEDLKTIDLEGQHQLAIGKRQMITWGLNGRFMHDALTNRELLKVLPDHKKLYLYGAFVQDEIALIRDKLRLTVGAKIEHNSYTGFEYQPNVRLTWVMAKNETLWAAVSRAVRTPSRIDRDLYLYFAPNILALKGDRFRSETLIAYELGWHTQPAAGFSFSLSAFYNVYDNIRSIEPGLPPTLLPYTLANGLKGNTYGIELATAWQLTSWWECKGGYTFFKKTLSLKPGGHDINQGGAEGNDPGHQFLLQSNVQLPMNMDAGAVLRYVDNLPKPYVPGYFGLDVRVSWKVLKTVELSIVGQNLLDDRHTEFATSSGSRQIQRNIYGKIACRL